MARGSTIRAVVFDAGHTLLEMDYVDVIGAQRAGLGGVLFDPGRMWGARDCSTATGLCAAVEQAVRSGAAA
ncbi:MAG: hypothetical protein ACRELZ_22810 [Candidatus Rokuibacteriota bacterium]